MLVLKICIQTFSSSMKLITEVILLKSVINKFFEKKNLLSFKLYQTLRSKITKFCIIKLEN